MLGFQECCDAITYSDLGNICLSRGWDACLNSYRPAGAMLLNALMYPYGLAPVSHGLLLIIAAFLPIEFLQISKVNSGGQAVTQYKTKIYVVAGAFTLLEFLFIGLASVNLTDVPAGVFAALAIWGFYRGNALLVALAAAASVLIRAAYLYPMFALIGYFLIENLYKKNGAKAATAMLFFLCLAPQFYLTWKYFGAFAFMDPTKVDYWRNIHLSSAWAGYDTLIPAAAHPWKSGATLGLLAAVDQHKWGELTTLLISRLDFYFASFAPLGKVYLNLASERIFSPFVLLLHCAAFIASFLYLKAIGNSWRIWVPLSIVLLQSLIIVPEQRFIFVIQLFLGLFSYMYILLLIKKWNE